MNGGAPLASIAYSILRRDWETGQTTRFVWDDLPVRSTDRQSPSHDEAPAAETTKEGEHHGR